MDAPLIAAPRTESPPGSSAPGTAPQQPGRASGGEPRARTRALPAATSVPPLCHKVTTGAATLLDRARGAGHPAQHVPALYTPVPASYCPTHIPVQPSVTPVQSQYRLTLPTPAVLCQYDPAVAQQSPVVLSLAWAPGLAPLCHHGGAGTEHCGTPRCCAHPGHRQGWHRIPNPTTCGATPQPP